MPTKYFTLAVAFLFSLAASAQQKITGPTLVNESWGYNLWQVNEGQSTIRILSETGIREKGTHRFTVTFDHPITITAVSGNVDFVAWPNHRCGWASTVAGVEADNDPVTSVKVMALGGTNKTLSINGRFDTPIVTRSLEIGSYDDECMPVTISWSLTFSIKPDDYVKR